MPAATKPKTASPKASAGAPAPKKRKASSSADEVSSSQPSTSAAPLIESRVSSTQALRAFKALQSHRKKHKAAQSEKSKETGKSLLPLDGDDDASESKTDDMVYLNVTVKRLAKEKKSKPFQM